MMSRNAVLAGLLVAVPAFAQVPNPIDPVNWDCPIGSFKLIDGKGQTSFSFTGTVLISGYKGQPIRVEGALRKEFDEAAKGRVAYFGTGRITLDGEWRGIQVFGRNLKGRFSGHGFLRIVGEFDKNLNTGTYWFDSTPAKKNPWFTSSMTLQIPPPAQFKNTPQRRGGG